MLPDKGDAVGQGGQGKIPTSGPSPPASSSPFLPAGCRQHTIKPSILERSP
ncbi:hypothetical protein [Scytonema sp. HK-05]|uniref:hypothetical protein n=1 Tax=Scytonema sp. HK-05 TaxID=1137095 RepID=UPI001E63D1AB|nr:hypothetical protein [Scytonema sp. HK-05]